MPYCSPQDVRDLHQLITEGDFPDADVQKYIIKAESRINDKLRVRYVVPFTQVPDIVFSICADMAASMLCQHHFSGVNYREDTPLAEVFRKRADDDLNYVIDNNTLDGLPGVVKHEPNVAERRKPVATTTPNPSPLKGTLREFDCATRNVRGWR
ncbi:phage protein Gp36 family protein [Paenibacillus alba]|uniref:DUF1320 family protein n=1 Tax=Paenibacillus alba TaxID=1197127 RepID=A0ABU6GAS4_9BACL|nr:phage protein Gp36 family protein [Paenibacillus alba]MEC0231291.1 DUF1320 family protein [Paenibacillus alba]